MVRWLDALSFGLDGGRRRSKKQLGDLCLGQLVAVVLKA